MIRAKRLREILAMLPDDTQLWGYEGEATGIGFRLSDGRYGFIYATDNQKDDVEVEGLPLAPQ